MNSLTSDLIATDVFLQRVENLLCIFPFQSYTVRKAQPDFMLNLRILLILINTARRTQIYSKENCTYFPTSFSPSTNMPLLLFQDKAFWKGCRSLYCIWHSFFSSFCTYCPFLLFLCLSSHEFCSKVFYFIFFSISSFLAWFSTRHRIVSCLDSSFANTLSQFHQSWKTLWLTLVPRLRYMICNLRKW